MFRKLALCALAAAHAAAAAAADRVVLPGHVAAATREAALARQVDRAPEAAGETVALTIVLRRDDEAGFERTLAALYDPASPEHRRWRSQQALADRYGPSEGAYAAVAAHFQDAGFAVVDRSANRLTLVVSAPRVVVERAFEVTLADFVVAQAAGGGRRAYANLQEPSLPAAIAARVQAVVGLSTLARPQPQVEAIQKLFCGGEAEAAGYNQENILQPGRTACEKAADACVTAGRIKAKSASEIKSKICAKFRTSDLPAGLARPADGPVPWKSADGTGQKVGITAFDTFAIGDVADFLDLYGADASMLANVGRVAVNGGASPGPDQSEVLLDVTTVLMGAPGAQAIVYDAPFGGAGSFQALFNRMIADDVAIISNSWAYCENQTSAADVQSLDAIAAAAAASGITILSASGDKGSTCLNGAADTAHVPASIPRITAVGGTSMVQGPDATWASERWWGSAPEDAQTGAGGYGRSRYFPRPAWQDGFHTAPFRAIPDLAFQADPRQGVVICQAAQGGCPAPLLYGGTSYAAPAVAAGVAVMNHARGARLGWLNPQVYPLAASGAFHTPADLGADFARVGLGSPIFDTLYRALTGTGVGATSATQSQVVVVGERVAADGTSRAFVVVRLRDANGHMVVGKTVALAQSPGGTATITPPSVASNAANGVAVFEVRAATPQQVTFTATNLTEGVPLSTPAPVAFVVPPAAAGSIQAFPTTVSNNGVATTTITVTLQDALGQPTPGKTVQLAQGGGRSVVTAPVPPVTDAAGQIQFTATDLHAETVTYTAVVATDGNVPVPGSATVTFSGAAPTSCVSTTPPTAAAGYLITPFVTGFRAEAFSYSNVNWGCAGGNNPAFRPDGVVLAGSFRTGTLYRLPPQGGAVSGVNAIATPGQTLGALVYGKDGRLYGFRGATGAGFFSGALYEFDPVTGATLRTLATGLACLSPLAVDPLSGDLFYTGTCFGAGSDDPRLYRVRNPGSATPVVETYATLPGTPNGAVSFAPDGTIYVAIQYLQPSPPVVRVSGTDRPQPPTVTPIAGLASIFWVTVAQTLPDGSAKSLIVLAPDNTVKLADLGSTPPTLSDLITSPMSSGVVGPDGCVYTSDGDTIHRITRSDGGCGFTPTNPVPAIVLTPALTTPDPPLGSTVTLSARLVGVPPAAGIPVIFRVSGANTQLRLARTDASGVATLALAGVQPGTDTVTADATLATQTLVSAAARVRWASGVHTGFLTLNPAPGGAVAGQPSQLSAILLDATADAPFAGATVQFAVAGLACSGVTDATGRATCSVTVPLPGTYALTASFAGNALLTADADATGFTVLPPPPGPCVAFDDVDATSAFCANVAWIRNRGITLGCQATLYCPASAVTRLQMAAFMNREGTTLTGRVLYAEAGSGAADLDAEPVVCQTADVATGAYPRRVTADGVYAGTAVADTSFAADVVASLDGGATWTPLSAVGNRGHAAAGRWGHVRAAGTADLLAGQTVRFGLWVSRGGTPGSTDLADSRCKLRIVVSNRQ